MSRRNNGAVSGDAAAQNNPVQSAPVPEIQSETVLASEAQTATSETTVAYTDYRELPAVVAAPLGLNLRTGPGPGYGVLDILPDGSPVTVLPLPYDVEVEGWALIVSESGTHGWVMTAFLAEPPAEE